MPSVVSVSLSTGVGALSGKVFIADDNFTNLRQLYWPPGVNALFRHGSGYVYQNRNYVMGAWTANLLIDENFRVLRQGIIPPQSPPSVTVGGGATEQICYLSFYDAFTDERSSISEGTSVTGNTTRTWTGLPTIVPGEAVVIEGTATAAGATITGTNTNFAQLRPGDRIADASAPTRWAVVRSIASDTSIVIDDAGTGWVAVTLVHKPVSRCTHLELWVAVAGALPRLSSRVPLGVTSFVESVPTLNLQEAFLDNFEPLPFCTMNVTYGDRQLCAGDPQNPDTLYLSNLFEHEQWGGLSFKTRFGEPIVGLVKMRDYVLALTPESSYTLQGYTEDDLEFRVNEPDLGGLGHTCNIVVRGKAYIPNSQGYFMYNGAWHSILEGNLGSWQLNYALYRREYETGIVAHDKRNHTILLVPNYDLVSNYVNTFFQEQEIIIWACDYTSLAGVEAGGISQPDWSWDTLAVNQGGAGAENEVHSAAYLYPVSTALGRLYKITRDGKVWAESSAVVGPDVEIVTSHLYFGQYGGDIQVGKSIQKLFAYYYGDYTEADIEVYAGDSYAYGDDIRARQEGPGVPGAIGIPIRFTPYKLSLSNGGVPLAASLLTTPPATAPPSVELQYGTLTWGIWQARTVFSWVGSGNTQPTGRGFTFKFVFTGHKLLEWYGLGGYYGPGEALRPIGWIQPGG